MFHLEVSPENRDQKQKCSSAYCASLLRTPFHFRRKRSVPAGIILKVSLENRYRKQKCCCLEYCLGVFCLFLEPPFIFKNSSKIDVFQWVSSWKFCWKIGIKNRNVPLRIIRFFLEPALLFKNRSVPASIILEVSLGNRYQKQKCCSAYHLGSSGGI